MEIKEAIKLLDELNIMTLYDGDSICNSEFAEALKIAISALEKQEAKKPKHIDKNGVFDGNWAKVCPTCGRVLIERIITDEISYPRHYNTTGYCRCGQKIDLSE